ncbi:MAG TPA: type II toxin-antitoxin system prevent-host-death family antitoxin [Terriglobales bacterium]|nr:type II toxin-antitoxin system prevent-host-death family antitoxin [Terriglobales bacterium]
MKTVTIHKAKTTLSRLIRDVSKGEEVVIARGKKPAAKLVPLDHLPKERKPGRLKGQFKLGPEFFEPLPAEELELWWK